MALTPSLTGSVSGPAYPGTTAAIPELALVQAKLTASLLATLSANPAGVTATLVALPQPDKAVLNLAGQLVEANITPGRLPQGVLQPGSQLQLTPTNGQPGQPPTLKLTSWQPPSTGTVSNAEQINPLKSPAQAGTVTNAEPPRLASAGLSPQLKMLLLDATARQSGPAPLLATLQAALDDQTAPIPPTLATLARGIFGLALQADQPVTAQTLKSAIANWTPSRSPADTTAPSSGPRQTPALPPAQVLLRVLSAAAQSALPESAQPALTLPSLANPPPPGRDAQPGLHPPLPAHDMAAKMTPEQRLASIASEASRAEERLTLHQAATLPADAARPLTEQPRQLVQSFDLPIMLSGQPMVTPFRIERDAPERSLKTGEQPAWSIRFAIDISVLGPIHAHLRLQPVGSAPPRLSMTLWAEQNDSREVLSALSSTLEAELSDSGFETGELTILHGKPATLPHQARPGHLLDRSS
jgi:hypothetical protein